MEYHSKLEALLPAKRTYFGQHILLCLVKLAVILLGLNALIGLMAAVISFPPVLWIALNLTATVLAAAYFWINRPGELQFARWLDEQLNSKERLQTLFELEQPPPRRQPGLEKANRGKKKDPTGPAGTAYRVQASPEMRALIIEETGRYLAAHPPAVTLDRRLFKRWLPGLLVALIVCAGALYISPALSQKVSRRQELKSAQQEAEQALAELEELLSGEPLLEELLAELALVKEQLAGSQNPEEVALSLQETRELLAEYAEKLDEAGQAYQLPEELLSANSAAEMASALQEDPRFNQQLLDSLQGLQDRLFQLSSAGALKLKQELSRIEGALSGETAITDKDVQDLLALMEQLDPASARAAVQSGLRQLASSSGSGEGNPQAGAGSSGESAGSSGGSTGSGTGGSQQGQNQGQETGQGQGSSGESSGSSGGSGQNGSGASGEGTGQQGEGSGGNPGSGGGSQSGTGGGSQGSGAGTGSGTLSEQQFYFIPGDQQVSLAGTGEEGSYTWQELLKFNPGLVPEDLSPYYDSYYHQGITSINRGQVPPPLENYLRAYFQAITPP